MAMSGGARGRGRRLRVEVLHGINLNMLGRRDRSHYGTISLAELEREIRARAGALGIEATCFQTNSEREYVERLHALAGHVDGLILNPGAWTHYAWSIYDALELTGLPAVEVHVSDVTAREPWRRVSVIADLCLETFAGMGVEGYERGLRRLRDELDGA
jgi:3-dehydroquinate dehydratase II